MFAKGFARESDKYFPHEPDKEFAHERDNGLAHERDNDLAHERDNDLTHERDNDLAHERDKTLDHKSNVIRILESLAKNREIGISLVRAKIKWRSLRMSAMEEKGTIEPALVLIPLMLLVLSTLQIAGGVYARATSSFNVQSKLYESALFSSDSSGDGKSASSVSDAPSDQPIRVERIQLPGGGTLLLGQSINQLPSVTPLLPEGDNYSSYPISVSEEP